MRQLRSGFFSGVALASFGLFVGACSHQSAADASRAAETAPRLTQQPFGHAPGGESIDLVTLRNQRGMEVRVMTYGAIVVSIRTPDRKGKADDVVLGHDTAEEYFSNPSYFGAVIGRYGNRIAHARFTLDGTTYPLANNDGVNHLHGGVKGWNQAMWNAEPFQDARGPGVVMTLVSPDGDGGYPGAVTAKVTYTLADDNSLVIDYAAVTGKPTVINMTQHSYFNLAGSAATDILGHELTIDADRYTLVDATLIPTGEIAPVADTPFDFRTAMTIGARIEQDNEQLKRGKGYDHNFVLNRGGDGLSHAAHVLDPTSGRTLDVTTTEPGIQFYSGNFLDGTATGKGGVKYGRRAGFCLETQHFPDSPNQAGFPTTILRPGERYTSRTTFKFGVVK